MSHLDISAASTPKSNGTSYVVGGLRPSIVIRQTSLSHDAGDRIEGVASIQTGAIADSEGDEESGATLRATNLDAVIRALLQLDGGSWSQRVPTLLQEAVRPAADSAVIAEESAELVTLIATLIQWPNIAIAACGEGVAIVASPASTEVVLGKLGETSQVSRLESHPSNLSNTQSPMGSRKHLSWQAELGNEATLIVGNRVFARRWSVKEVTTFMQERRRHSASSIANALIDCQTDALGDAASVMVAKVIDGAAPTEDAVASEEETAGNDGSRSVSNDLRAISQAPITAK